MALPFVPIPDATENAAWFPVQRVPAWHPSQHRPPPPAGAQWQFSLWMLPGSPRTPSVSFNSAVPVNFLMVVPGLSIEIIPGKIQAPACWRGPGHPSAKSLLCSSSLELMPPLSISVQQLRDLTNITQTMKTRGEIQLQLEATLLAFAQHSSGQVSIIYLWVILLQSILLSLILLCDSSQFPGLMKVGERYLLRTYH